MDSEVSPNGEIMGKLNFTAKQLYFYDRENFTNKPTKKTRTYNVLDFLFNAYLPMGKWAFAFRNIQKNTLFEGVFFYSVFAVRV